MPNIYYKTYYHAIWSTKNRVESIDEQINALLKRAIFKKTKDLKGILIEYNSYLDHCHLLATIPPKISVSEFIGQIKGFSSHEINKTADDSIKWQRGFGVVTLSEKGVPFIKKYIQNQKQHYKNDKLIDMLEHIPEEK